MANKQKQPSNQDSSKTLPQSFIKFKIIRDEPVPDGLCDLKSNIELVHKFCMLSGEMSVGDSVIFNDIFEANILIHCFNMTGQSSFIMKKKRSRCYYGEYYQVWRV